MNYWTIALPLLIAPSGTIMQTWREVNKEGLVRREQGEGRREEKRTEDALLSFLAKVVHNFRVSGLTLSPKDSDDKSL